MELSQCFQRFGSEVTVLDVADRVLLKEEREAADIVYNACIQEGLKFILPAKIINVSQNEAGEIVIALDGGPKVRWHIRSSVCKHCSESLTFFLGNRSLSRWMLCWLQREGPQMLRAWDWNLQVGEQT